MLAGFERVKWRFVLLALPITTLFVAGSQPAKAQQEQLITFSTTVAPTPVSDGTADKQLAFIKLVNEINPRLADSRNVYSISVTVKNNLDKERNEYVVVTGYVQPERTAYFRYFFALKNQTPNNGQYKWSGFTINPAPELPVGCIGYISTAVSLAFWGSRNARRLYR